MKTQSNFHIFDFTAGNQNYKTILLAKCVKHCVMEWLGFYSFKFDCISNKIVTLVVIEIFLLL